MRDARGAGLAGAVTTKTTSIPGHGSGARHPRACHLASTDQRSTDPSLGRSGSAAGQARRRLLRGEARLDGLNVHCVRTLGPVLSVVADLRALGQRLEAVAGNAGVVHEQVLALIVGRDEAEALLVAEPLHSSGSHQFPPGRFVCCETREVLKQQLRDAGTAFAEQAARQIKCNVANRAVALQRAPLQGPPRAAI